MSTATAVAPGAGAVGERRSPASGAGTGRRPVPALGDDYEFVYVPYTDPLGEPLLRDLEREYDERYGVEVLGEPAIEEINRYPAERFAPPLGAFLLLLHRGEAISGGAFMPYEPGADGAEPSPARPTAEVKRVWTRADARGRGLARLVLTELERRAAELGYARIYLTTGPRQPEARILYLRHGYTALFDTGLSDEEIRERGEILPFEKELGTES